MSLDKAHIEQMNKLDELIKATKERPLKAPLSLGKNIFIVHGNDHQPMKELKSMLYELGLNPIVLHEQASGGSSTLPEKLEKYSEEVGYAFVILTPDDFGGPAGKLEAALSCYTGFDISARALTLCRFPDDPMLQALFILYNWS